LIPVVLLLLVMGVIVAPRRAGAGPNNNCKPNRATCTANHQCCSGDCIAGLCAAFTTTSAPTTTSTPTTTSSSTTTTTTPGAICGNGILEPGEACDDGNQQTESACPYGTPTCSACNAGCSQILNLVGNVCGDGARDLQHEDCDDGNTCTESVCPYGTASCDLCSSSCKMVARTGSVCGDGSVDVPYETCDDGNADACGSCSADCKAVQEAEATGLIVPVPLSEISDGASFTIDDGLGTVAVFEFDDDANVSSGATSIALDANPARSHAAIQIAAAINSHATLLVDAVADGPVVLLSDRVKSSLGNQAIVASGVSTDFYVTGMSGGMGRDCASGTKCTSDADCASGVCGQSELGVCD